MKISVFCGVSVDGFIARKNDDLDFLPEDPEPHGYDEFIATVDVTVMGRRTFDKVLTFGAWPFKKRVVVLSHRPVDLSVAAGGLLEQMAGTPAEIVERLADDGCATHLSRRRDHDTGIYARGAGAADDRHSDTGTDRRGHSFVWCRCRRIFGFGMWLLGQYASGLVQSEYLVGE